MAAEISINYKSHLRCEAKREKTGKTVTTDVGADHGGLDDNFSPVELTVAAVGTCVMSMMAVVGERSGVDLSTTQIRMGMEMASLPHRRIGSIKMTIVVPNGKDVSEDNRKKIEAAAKSCPVKNSLHPDIKVEMEFIYE